MVMNPPTGTPGDLQAEFSTRLAVTRSERLAGALGLKASTCMFCGATYPNSSMIRRDKRIFCSRIHGAYFFRLWKGELLALKGEDDAAMSVKGIGDAIELASGFTLSLLPSLSRLLEQTVEGDVDDAAVVTVAEDGTAHQNERIYGENDCKFCGKPVPTHEGRGRRMEFCGPAHRVAYNRLKKAMAEGKVAEMLAESDETAELTVQPTAVEDVSETIAVARRAYIKRSSRWTPRKFGVIDWSDPVFKTIQLFQIRNTGKVAVFCKCGVRFGPVTVERAGFWAEMHVSQLRQHAKNLERRRSRLSIMRRVKNEDNAREWDGFVIGQVMPHVWVTN